MTLLEHFDEYLRNCFPDPPSRDTALYKLLRNAFVCGCLTAYTETTNFAPEMLAFHKLIEQDIQMQRATAGPVN